MLNRITPVVLNIVILNALVFLFIALNEKWFFESEIFLYFWLFKSDLVWNRPPGYDFFNPIQLVSSMFTHREFWHFLMNSFALISIGSVVEMVVSRKEFVGLYLFSGLFGTLFTYLLDPDPTPVIGASGAISGVVVAFAYYFPTNRLGLLFLPFSFTAKSFAIGFAVISAVLVIATTLAPDQTGILGSISHFGHLAGMLGGLIFLNRKRVLSIFNRN